MNHEAAINKIKALEKDKTHRIENRKERKKLRKYLLKSLKFNNQGFASVGPWTVKLVLRKKKKTVVIYSQESWNKFQALKNRGNRVFFHSRS